MRTWGTPGPQPQAVRPRASPLPRKDLQHAHGSITESPHRVTSPSHLTHTHRAPLWGSGVPGGKTELAELSARARIQRLTPTSIGEAACLPVNTEPHSRTLSKAHRSPKPVGPGAGAPPFRRACTSLQPLRGAQEPRRNQEGERPAADRQALCTKGPQTSPASRTTAGTVPAGTERPVARVSRGRKAEGRRRTLFSMQKVTKRAAIPYFPDTPSTTTENNHREQSRSDHAGGETAALRLCSSMGWCFGTL